ncbi:MAG TPA: diguanylate cyclase [Pirellulales bacterium]|nr:diguanylate cyclase [Pirellulales bacterium]
MLHDLTPRILVIDDQESIHADYQKIIGPRQFNSSALSKAVNELFGEQPLVTPSDDVNRFEIDSAYQGEEGLRRVQQALQEGRPYSVAFVDIRMPPGWDGVETVSRIWEIDPELLVVLCTAYSDYSWEEMVRRLGRTDRFLILKKPFENIEVRQLAMALSEKWRVNRTDMLTGLLNRRSFCEHLEREWNRSLRQGHPLSCVLLDIDFFKRINDEHGHHEGDAALKLVANLLGELSRAGDFVCRYGGEELCALLPDTNEEGATIWAERARTALADAGFKAAGRSVRLSASFGVAQRADDIAGAHELLQRADQAMLVAKQSGRNRTVRFTSLASPIASGLADMPQSLNLFEGVIARQVMTSPVLCLQSDSTAGEAANHFLETRINSAPVIDATGKLVGILSEKDVMWTMLWTDSWTKPIAEIMQTTVVSYSEETPIQAIFDFLCRVTIRRVVVVRDGQPTGVISRASLLRWFTNWVATHHGQVLEGNGDGDAGHAQRARPRMTEAAESLVQLAQRLLCELSDEEQDDLASPVVEGVSKMQELMNDLLAYSRHVHRTAAVPEAQAC